jgi:exportin-1
LDYWNSLVLELFEPHHNLDTPAATVNMMGLQVECIYYQMVVVKWINVVVS